MVAFKIFVQIILISIGLKKKYFIINFFIIKLQRKENGFKVN